jgi:hypothetical protein
LTTIAWRICHLIDMLAADRNATWIGVTPETTRERDGEPATAEQAIHGAEVASLRDLYRATAAGHEP